ncbi:MAG: hypothetical protein ACRERD_30710 [Candidatus Binatia bacterium]
MWTEDQQGNAFNPWRHIMVNIFAGIGLGIGATLIAYLLYMIGLRPKGVR